MVDNVKKQNKNCRSQFEREVASRTELEMHLKKVVNKVLKERKKEREENKMRKSAGKFYITALDSAPNLTNGQNDDYELSQEERERVIELLLGKDEVIALLYDRDMAMINTNDQQQPFNNEHLA